MAQIALSFQGTTISPRACGGAAIGAHHASGHGFSNLNGSLGDIGRELLPHRAWLDLQVFQLPYTLTAQFDTYKESANAKSNLVVGLRVYSRFNWCDGGSGSFPFHQTDEAIARILF